MAEVVHSCGRNPSMMSVLIGAIIMLGTLLLYTGLFKRPVVPKVVQNN